MRNQLIAALLVLTACSSGSQGSTAAAPAPTGTAQAAGTCPLEQGTMVLNTSFSNVGERAALNLRAGCIYWATTNVSGVKLALRARVTGTAMPYMAETMGAGVAGGSTWELRSSIDGEYEIWAAGMQGGNPVKVEVTVRGSMGQ
jgi:hypothetical protein